MERTESQLLFGSHFLTAAAQDGTRPYFNAVLQSIKKAVNEHDWRTVVSISKKLYANMGIPKGAIKFKANFTTGKAWDPVYMGTNKAWGEQATKWLTNEYFPVYNVRGPMFDFKTDLWLDSVAIDRQGDIFTMFTGSGDGFPMVQTIPNHLIKSPRMRADRDVDIEVKVPRHLTDGTNMPDNEAGPVKRKMRAAYVINGIAYSSANYPFAYCVHKDEELLKLGAESYEWVHAQYICHTFDPEYHEQGRGLPAFSHAVRQFLSMLTSQEFEEITQMILSSISLIENNETGTADANDPTTALTSTGGVTRTLATQESELLAEGTAPDVLMERIIGGMVRYFKAGSGGKVEPMAKNVPGDMWEKFQDRLVRTCLVGIGVPYAIIWKHNENTGVADRSDIEIVHSTIQDRQELLFVPAYRKVCYGVAVAMNTGRLPRNTEDWHQWAFTMPPEFSIDDGKLADSKRKDYVMGHENLTCILGSRGRILEPFLRERAQEIYLRKKIAKEYSKDGIIIEDWEMGTVNPQGVKDADPNADPENPDAVPAGQQQDY
jgi:hypothetical protein